MMIGGLQKLTLLDYPGKIACTVFTAGCDFRCPFCHNSELVLPERLRPAMTVAEVLNFLSTRVGKLDGVCISGGEPLLQQDLPEFIGRVKDMGFAVKLDTNGYRPEKLSSLIQAGWLDYVAMDFKNSFERYGETVGLENVDVRPVLESMVLLQQNAVAYEFRTTVVRQLHGAAEISAMAGFVADSPWFLQTFIDSGDTLKPDFSAYTQAEMTLLRDLARQTAPRCQLRGM